MKDKDCRLHIRHQSGIVDYSCDARSIFHQKRTTILRFSIFRFIKRCQELGIDPSELEIELT